MKRLLVVVAIFVAVSTRADVVPAEKIYGRSFVDAVRRADSVDAQRISVEYPRSESGTRIVKITPKGDSLRLSTDGLSLLKRAFLKESEEDQATKLCSPMPGVRYVFRSSVGSVSVLVCYKCRIALIDRDGDVIREVYVDHVIADLRKAAASFLSAEEVAKLP